MPSRPPGSQDVEWLDLGPPDPPDRSDPVRSPRPSRRIVVAAVLAAVVVAAGIVTAVVATGHKRTATPARTSASSSPSGGVPNGDAPEVTATAPSRSGPPVVTVVGHPLLGITDRWELFVRGDNVVARVQLAAGRVTVTPAPTLGSGGAIAFLVTAKSAFAVPSDFVPGYAVADGSAATLLQSGLANGGNVYPGPVDGQFWQQVAAQGPTSAYVLIDAAGRNLHRTIALPQTVTGPAVADGSGYLIVPAVSGSYDARPGSLRRITTGQVTAVGPTAWLAEECDDVGQCSDVVVNKATWQRQVVGPSAAAAELAAGVISPDGSVAAVVRAGRNRGFAVSLIETATGAEHTVADIPDGAFGDQNMAWSPDGRWLFLVGSNGTIQVINSVTLQHTSLGVRLPPAVQVAIRPAS